VVPHDWLHADVSVPAVVSTSPSATTSAGADAMRQFALSGVPLSALGWWRWWVTTSGGTKSIGSVACRSNHLKNLSLY
jgi:hypothetical protein